MYVFPEWIGNFINVNVTTKTIAKVHCIKKKETMKNYTNGNDYEIFLFMNPDLGGDIINIFASTVTANTYSHFQFMLFLDFIQSTEFIPRKHAHFYFSTLYRTAVRLINWISYLVSQSANTARPLLWYIDLEILRNIVMLFVIDIFIDK